MGELTRFAGIIIKMYNYDTNKHKEPHFHVYCSNGDTAVIDIRYNVLLAGKLNHKNLRKVTVWANNHRLELLNRWNNAVSGSAIKRI